MSPCLRRVAIGLVALAVLGAGAVFTGLIPISARAGHWAVTEWVLHFAMRRAVHARALGVGEPPELDDPSMVLRGAGHYATGCAPCHGAPGAEPSRVTRHMTPAPPELVARVDDWSPAQLFWIVRNGVKFTGMPAWPAAGREDEVWAVVAFLRRLPGLSAGEYRRLAFGGSGSDGKVGAVRLEALAEPLRQAVRSCERCHGADGDGRLPGAVPRLAGLEEPYLAATLDAYAAGERHSGIMEPVAAGLDRETRRRLAEHFSAFERKAALERIAPGVRERGEAIARRGVPARKVAACVPCHGPGGGPRNPAYPELAGQYAEYLALQLRLFTEGARGGTVWSDVMEISAHRLEPEEIDDVAAWYGSLDARP